MRVIRCRKPLTSKHQNPGKSIVAMFNMRKYIRPDMLSFLFASDMEY